ncbi:MAG: carboxymuconolactone decarboxylase family protein [Thermodesulfobacteriota bacterium]
MPRLNYVEPEEADAFTRKLFDQVGMVPNLYCMMANSSTVFDGFLKLTRCLEAARLDKKTREMVYLLTSQINGCDYCLASHTSTSVEHGVMTKEETLQARKAQSPDPRVNAMLGFAKEVVEKRGHVSDETLEQLRAQGFSDEEIVEALATIALATLSNYVAIVGDVELDYLEAPPLD